MPELLNDNHEEKWIATAAVVCGDIVQAPSGDVAIITTAQPAAIGDAVAGQRRGLVKVANSGITPAAGATIGYDATAKQAVGAGLGDYDIGKAAAAVAAGTDPVYVFLNE